jgi:hypothetical protein
MRLDARIDRHARCVRMGPIDARHIRLSAGEQRRGADLSFQGYLAYQATNERTLQSKLADFASIMDYVSDYNCVPGSPVSNCQAAFNAAIQNVYNKSQSYAVVPLSVSGNLHVPSSVGCFRITGPITMLQGVSLTGEGGLGSCILADDTDALYYFLDVAAP